MTSILIPGVRDSRIFCLDLPIEAQPYVDTRQFGITVDALNAVERRRLHHIKQQDLADTRCCVCAILSCACCCICAIPFCFAINRHHKATQRMATKYYEVLAEHNEKHYNPQGVTLKVNNDTTVASGTSYGAAGTSFHSASSTKWYLTIEISSRAISPPKEESAVVNLKLMTTPPKEISIRIVDDATFADLLVDARAAFHLDKSISMQAVDSKGIVYSGRANVMAALAKNNNKEVYVAVDM